MQDEIDIGTITPSDTQGRAIAEIVDWFKNRTGEQQIFRLFGYAGTGKTTLTRYAIEELGLSMFTPPPKGGIIRPGEGGYRDTYPEEMIPDVFFAAYTGKASYVMRKHGTPAQTIHSMIYSVHSATDEEIAQAELKLADLVVEAMGKTGLEKFAADAAIEGLRIRIHDMKLPTFGLNMEADVRDAKLIVLDEVSMVNNEMAAHLMAFGKPILVLGDPGQLPPVKGEGAFTMQDPDIMLTEIHRQALDSPIIRIATMAREGQHIPFGKYSDIVWKMPKRGITAQQLLRADQVICGRNATRLDLNNGMRRAAGFDGELPTGPEEKIICLRNINGVGLINGMFLSLSEIERANDLGFRAKIIDEDGRHVTNSGGNRFVVYSGHFADHIQLDKDRHDRDWKDKRNMVEATYGWAITCHKAQGSQWRNVIVYDDRLSRSPEDRNRWLYTAITRAEEGLVILD